MFCLQGISALIYSHMYKQHAKNKSSHYIQRLQLFHVYVFSGEDEKVKQARIKAAQEAVKRDEQKKSRKKEKDEESDGKIGFHCATNTREISVDLVWIADQICAVGHSLSYPCQSE